MKGYVLAVAGAILLSALFTALLPEGKLGKFLKGMGGLFVFAAVVAPLSGLFTGKVTAEEGTALGQDAGYLASCADFLERYDAQEAEKLLGEQFSLRAEATAERGTEAGFPLRKITVKIYADGIIGQDEHIDMAERVKNAIEERYGCTAEVIWIG